jgi:hypothetical protein
MVSTTSTEQCALCDTELGTLPTTRCKPRMPRLPTTMRSALSSFAVFTSASAASPRIECSEGSRFCFFAMKERDWRRALPSSSVDVRELRTHVSLARALFEGGDDVQRRSVHGGDVGRYFDRSLRGFAVVRSHHHNFEHAAPSRTCVDVSFSRNYWTRRRFSKPNS